MRKANLLILFVGGTCLGRVKGFGDWPVTGPREANKDELIPDFVVEGSRISLPNAFGATQVDPTRRLPQTSSSCG